MSCTCDKAKPIPSCVTTLVIGDVVNGSIPYYVYLKTPDGRLDRYDSVDFVYTDQIGVEDIEVRIGTQYEIWITKTTAANSEERESFTVFGETTASTCVLVEFVQCNTEYTSQIITLA